MKTNTHPTPPRFERGEAVIWDSGFGYEIGYFECDGNTMGTYLIDIRTGRQPGLCSHPCSEVYKYTDVWIDELTQKYGYEKRFSPVF